MLNKEIYIKQFARHFRVVFFVQNNLNYMDILNEIFIESYDRWGELKTFIIPIEEGNCIKEYLPWLINYDPDIIYSYCKLNHKMIKDLDKLTKPFLFLNYEYRDSFDIDYDNHSFQTFKLILDNTKNGKLSDNKLFLSTQGGGIIKDEFIGDNFGIFNSYEIDFILKLGNYDQKFSKF